MIPVLSMATLCLFFLSECVLVQVRSIERMNGWPMFVFSCKVIRSRDCRMIDGGLPCQKMLVFPVPLDNTHYKQGHVVRSNMNPGAWPEVLSFSPRDGVTFH